MFYLKKLSFILRINAVCLLLIVGLAHTEERHLVNPITASLREGPGSHYKFIKTLPSDQSFEVIETLNGFIRIRTKDGVEGWLQDKFTETRPPEVITVNDSKKKFDTLVPNQSEKTTSNSVKLAAQSLDASIDSQPKKEFSEQPNARESTEIKKLQAEISEITQKYNQLEASSEDDQQLKIDNDRLKAELSATQKTIAKLQQTNISQEKNKNIYWFIAGSAVFLLGWLVGRISLRRQRHSSLTL